MEIQASNGLQFSDSPSVTSSSPFIRGDFDDDDPTE